MPVYQYTALDQRGKKIRGILDADSRAMARQKIRQAGHYPVDIRETSPARERSVSSLPIFQRTVPAREIHAMTRQLATMLEAGIPLVPALSGLIDQTDDQTLKGVLARIKDQVNEGHSLTSALAEHPRLFSRIYVNMVQAGEASGSLGVVLERLADFGENQQALRARIRAALLYPLFMALVGCVVLFLLVGFIVPTITKVFEGTRQALPLPTIILIRLGDFLSNYWWALLLVLVMFGIGLRIFFLRPFGRRLLDNFRLRAPGLGDLSVKIASARLSRTLASLLQAGVPLFTSLGIVRNIMDNVILAEVLEEASRELEKGRSLSQVLRASGRFPPMLVQMISVGEQSGALEKMLDKAARSYEREIEARILALTSMIEPVMILAMGLVVSFIVISILLPIFDMNQLIR